VVEIETKTFFTCHCLILTLLLLLLPWQEEKYLSFLFEQKRCAIPLL